MDAPEPSTEAARPGPLVRARHRLYEFLWHFDIRELSPVRRAVLLLARLIFVTTDSFFRERLQLRAAALAFWTVLSIVPTAALVFSLAKGVGLYDALVRDTVRPYIERTFAPAGNTHGVQVLRDTLEEILDLVGETDVRGLGIIGLVVLIITIGRVVRLAEESFDAIWGFVGRRRLQKRIPGYVIVPLFTPAALVFATTLTAARQGEGAMALIATYIPSGFLVSVIAFVLPPFFTCLAMFPLYVLVPSAAVRVRSAMIGALVGGLGWYLFQVVHVTFQVGVARNNALYSGFGAVPIFLLWLHLSWVWVLIGAQVASAHQNAPTLRQLARSRLTDHKSRQAVALRSMVALAGHTDGANLRLLAREIGVGVAPLREVLDALVEHSLLRRDDGDYDPCYRPAVDLDTTRVAAILEALGQEPTDEVGRPWEKQDEPLTKVLNRLQSAVESSDHNYTIGELRRVADRRSRAPADRG